jgi:hypothetical protein
VEMASVRTISELFATAPQSSLAVDPQKSDLLIRLILDVFNSTNLTAQQGKDVFTHLQVLVEIG